MNFKQEAMNNASVSQENLPSDPRKHTEHLKQSGRFYTEEMGWKIVPLHGVVDGRCTCQDYRDRKGLGNCSAPGKRPAMNEWDKNAFSDPDALDRQIDQQPQGNLGLLLGPASGVIDIEFDDEVGRATAEKLFADVVTPSYESERSRHYLFKWSARLPDVQKVEPSDGPLAGLEIRIGNGDKATQSVLPPSRHYKGKSYRWVDGMHPAQVELAELPREVLAVLVNYDPQAGGTKRKRDDGLQRLLDGEILGEGKRNNAIFRYACRMIGVYGDKLDIPENERDFLSCVHARNQTQCDPPMSHTEVEGIIESARRYEKVREIDPNADPNDFLLQPDFEPQGGDPKQRKNGPMMGLEVDPATSEICPGDWSLTRVLADPVYYKLTIPAVAEHTVRKDGHIRVALGDIANHLSVAACIQAGTSGYFLPQNMPMNWGHTWNGKAGTKNVKATIGLRRLLWKAMKDEEPDIYDERWRDLLEHLLGMLNGAADMVTIVKDGKEIACPGHFRCNGAHYPSRHPDGSVWFQWNPVWKEAVTAKMFTDQEVRQLRQMLGVVTTRSSTHRWEKRAYWNDRNQRYIRFTEEDLSELQSRLDR